MQNADQVDNVKPLLIAFQILDEQSQLFVKKQHEIIQSDKAKILQGNKPDENDDDNND